jgi:ribosomal protein S27E
MTARPVASRHWRTYGNNYPLPTGIEALDEPFAAFPSWFLRVTCERCGHERMFSKVHSAQRAMLIRTILAKMRHDGCGGQGRWSCSPASSRPVRTSALLG